MHIKVAGVPGVTEALFMARQTALAEESNSTTTVAPMSYSCTLCRKGYRSSKAHAEHLKTCYVDVEGKQLVAADGVYNSIELGGGGSELVITNKSEKGTPVTTLGSREFSRYYRQKPRPSVAADRALALSLASSYKSMGLVMVQSKQQMVRLKVLRAMNRGGVDMMRSKMGMKSNVIRNLPNNVPY